MTQNTSHAFQFANARLALDVCGVGDANLALIEERLSLDIANRSDEIVLHGDQDSVELGFAVLESLYDRARRGLVVEPADVEAAIRKAFAGRRKRLQLFKPGAACGDVHVDDRRQHEERAEQGVEEEFE